MYRKPVGVHAQRVDDAHGYTYLQTINFSVGLRCTRSAKLENNMQSAQITKSTWLVLKPAWPASIFSPRGLYYVCTVTRLAALYSGFPIQLHG